MAAMVECETENLESGLMKFGVESCVEYNIRLVIPAKLRESGCFSSRRVGSGLPDGTPISIGRRD
jgi:hypothetical protein